MEEEPGRVDCAWEAAGAFAAALLVRGALAVALGPVTPIGDDQRDYLGLRTAIHARHAFLDPTTHLATAFRDPGYPVFLSLLGPSLGAVWMTQALLAAATGALLVAASAGAGRMVARTTAILFVLHLSFASYTFFAYTESLGAFSLAVLLWSLSTVRERSAPGALALGALAAGASLLTRFSSLLSLAGVGLTAAAGSRSHRGSWIAAALLALLPIGLWCVRNEIRVGRFTPNTNGAVNLYLGNNIHTPLVYAYRAMNDSAAWAPLLPLGETARADEALRRVTAYASRQPGRMLLGMVMRIPDALESDRILLGVARRGQFPQRPPRLLLVIAGVVLFVTLVPTTLAVACAINPPDHWLAHAGRWALIGTVLTQAITIAHSRFTLLAWLALLPGAAITWERLRSGDRATRNAVFVSTAVVFALLVRQWRLA